MDEPTPDPATPATRAEALPRRIESRTARNGLQIIALGALAVALVMALVSANAIVAVWFEDRFVPIARLVFALGVAAVSLVVILRLSAKRI